ncbi:uncharacterized protein LOC101847194 [Aplysia californica]|uniref:Uncharacterized protein LOC101847194 n=1 Tax=Aplysia californica TaxID=6500 RepID=A0ABM1VUS1_APLCA|nr:uncharacterized protein LOC101847194 [Aplysia californica]
MGILDFETVFDELDSSRKGYVTIDQVKYFLESIFEDIADDKHVYLSVEKICGPGSETIPKERFYLVLEEIERRKTLDSEAYWDFQALDYSGSGLIALKDALLLFQEYHADQFSLDTWHEFLCSRDSPDADVYFNEIRDWLCDIPRSSYPSTKSEVRKERASLEHRRTDAAYQDLEDMKVLLQDEDLDRQERGERTEDILHHSKRKLNKWNQHGLDSLLHDDGLGQTEGDEQMSKLSDTVTTSNVMEALDLKYSLLQDKVIVEMASFAANMDSEKSETFQQIKRLVTASIKSKSLAENVDDLPGAKVELSMSLLGLIGDLHSAEANRKEKFKSLASELQTEERTDEQVDAELAERYKRDVAGPRSCGAILTQLDMRHKAERDAVLHSLHQSSSSLPPSAVLALAYWHLLRQLRLLQLEPFVTSAAISVGLAERKQEYKPKRYDWDRQRSEILANLRLESRRGHRPIKRSTAAPDLDSLQSLALAGIKQRLVEEMEQRYFLEREAMVFLLQGPDSKSSFEAAAKMSPDERKLRIRTLRNQREEWKMMNNSDSSVNHKLLQEATGLYFEQSRADVESKDHNATDSTVMSFVLADLQQRQEVEFEKTVSEIHKKNAQEVTRLVLSEIEATKEEHFNSIAYVILGCVDLSAEDTAFLKVLDGKYKALRDQVFVFGLVDKMGSEWKGLSKENKQREILRQRKEEKRLRGEGLLEQMSALIGPRSQALALLPTLVGEDKVFPNSSPPQTSESRSINLLADLVPRFDQEQDSLVSWLRSEEVKGSTLRSKHGQLTRIAMEKFAASAERDHETALLFVGLLERIGMALSGRSKSDREKQILLAQKRATLRKKCVNQGEKQKPPPEEKDKSNENDERTMQAIYMRAVLRRHYKEREVMLNLLQDEGMEELLEAAAVMSVDQGRKRMQELQDKRENMDLDDKANQEEHTSILEEAGAIRCASKKFAMVMDGGRAVLMDEVVVQLLAELQDLQDRDLATILNQLGTLNGHEMQEKAWAEEKAKKNSHSHLVMKVFMKFDGGSSDIDFDQLLDAKYRKLRDHLIDECLSQRQGKLKWAKMGQKQKNKLISTFQAKESALWNEGDSGSLSACLTPAFTLKPTLPYLSGMSRQQYSSAVWAGSEDPIQENEGLNPDDQGNGETISFLHRRYMAEVDFVKNYIAGCLEKVPEESDKKLLENKLKWECQLVSSVGDFVTASLVCGLAERQNTDRVFRLKLDHDRYGLLAQQLLACKREQIKKSADIVKGDDVNKLQEAVMTLLHKKHQDEWNILCQMMASDRFKEVRELVATETQQQKSDRLMVLHGIREKFDLAASSEHQTILEEAVTVKREMRRCHLSGQSSSGEVGDSEVNVSLMADLLKTQLVEAEIYLGAFSAESNEDLIENQQAIAAELTQSHAINIADVVFAAEGHDSADSQNQDGLLEEAVDGKYDALRDQLLIQALINEMGEAEWNRLSEKERQRRLMELKLKERQLRREGRYDEAAALLGSLLNDEEKLRQLLGDSKAEQERKLRERLERRKKRLAEGMTEEECDELEAEEIAREEEEEREKKKNILLYLEHCHDEEKAALLRRLAEMKDESEKQRQKQLEMLRLRREQRRLREEDKFDSAAMVLGLSEENDKRHKMSKDEERQRQQDLARQRLEAARQRKLQGENMVRGETIVLPEGEMEDESKVGETALRMLDRRHQLERDLLIKLLDEGSESEQRDEVRVLTDDELKMKLLAAQELYELWRNSDSGEKEDGEKILAEVAVLSLEVKKRDMQADGELASDEDVKVALLAELQMKQDGEAAQMMETLTTVDNEHKKQILNSQRKQLEDKRYDNVAGILFTFANEEDIFGEGKGEDEEEKTEEEKEDDKVVKALEKKYDAMRDKLLIEALMKEMGEGDWNRLSELERQKKLLELKMKEKRLRREGKMDEVAALLGQFLDDNEEMRRMLGETEEDQKRRMQEKLALRRKLKEEREAQGLAVDDETLDELVEEEDKKIRRRNVLENLDHQFEAEKAALLAAFKRQNDQLEREKERQLAVAKLKEHS